MPCGPWANGPPSSVTHPCPHRGRPHRPNERPSLRAIAHRPPSPNGVGDLEEPALLLVRRPVGSSTFVVLSFAHSLLPLLRRRFYQPRSCCAMLRRRGRRLQCPRAEASMRLLALARAADHRARPRFRKGRCERIWQSRCWRLRRWLDHG